MNNTRRNAVRRGFTLVELLVVIGIIAMLIAILMPGLNRARQAAYKIKCAANIRSMLQASFLRCQENRNSAYFPNDDGGDDSLGHLVPQYIKDPSVALCPAASNTIRRDVFFSTTGWEHRYPLKVLQDIAVSASDRNSVGHSYEPFAWYTGGVWADGRVLDGRKFGTYNGQMGISNTLDPRYKTPNTEADAPLAVLKKFGKLVGPTTTILIADIDKDSTTDFAKMNNWPNKGNNHGEEGANFGFGDGHVEFVRRGPEYIKTFVNSYQGLAQNTVFTQKYCPGLIISSTTVSGDRYGRSWSRYVFTN
ncbi:MAG: type II secretion system protein [Tepidisphaeraceae bacterium]